MNESGAVGRSTRLHYIDWLRVLATLGVFLYHAARPFVLQDWLISNEHQSIAVTFVFLVFLGSWGMPLFFMMAGAGSSFALQRRSGRQYVIERVKRLLIPFIILSILLSPIQFFLKAVHKGWYSGSFLGFIPVFLQSLVQDLAQFSPRIFESFGSHLWFLGYLFSFSLIALPLFLWLKTASGQRIIGRLGGLGARRGGLLVLVIPLVLVRLSLQPAHSEYAGWADFTYMLVYFIYGYVLYADERFISAIQRDAWLTFLLAIATSLIMVGTVIAGVAAEWATTPSIPQFYFAWGVVVLNGWCWTSFALYVGMRLLNRRNRWLEYGQEAILPFYLFHQPVIVALAFFLVQWDISPRYGAGVDILVKLPIIVFGSFTVTIGLYQLILRRFPPARALLGMKPKTPATTQPAEPGSLPEGVASGLDSHPVVQ